MCIVIVCLIKYYLNMLNLTNMEGNHYKYFLLPSFQQFLINNALYYVIVLVVGINSFIHSYREDVDGLATPLEGQTATLQERLWNPRGKGKRGPGTETKKHPATSLQGTHHANGTQLTTTGEGCPGRTFFFY